MMINPEDRSLEINEKLFRQIQKAITRWPENFDMATEGQNFAYTPKEMKKPKCGSAACLFGWAVALGTNTPPAYLAGSIKETGQELLGLTHFQANWFYFGFFCKDANQLEKITPEEASLAIDLFLESKGKVLPKVKRG